MLNKKFESRFAIISSYVDDMNLIGPPEELSNIIEYLKEFEIKDLVKSNYILVYSLSKRQMELLSISLRILKKYLNILT